MIHGPSLAIGAIIASIAIIIAFVGFDSISNQTELVIEPAPTVQQVGPAKITINTFTDNGSPILGNPDAPVWFIGMEEGGGGEDNLRARLKFEQIEDLKKRGEAQNRLLHMLAKQQLSQLKGKEKEAIMEMYEMVG